MQKKVNLDDADSMSRKLVLATIRAYCKASGLYAKASSLGMGLDKCEESVKELIEYGLLIIYVNEENDTLSIEPLEEADDYLA